MRILSSLSLAAFLATFTLYSRLSLETEPFLVPKAQLKGLVITAPRLPDTGQSAHYTKTFGEDSDYAGPPLAFTDNEDGTITDKTTGLVWQKVDGGEMTWEKAKEYAASLKLGGRADWRLPTSMELFSIVDHSRQRPPLDIHYFEPTDADYWWSISNRVDDPSKIWIVNAGGVELVRIPNLKR